MIESLRLLTQEQRQIGGTRNHYYDHQHVASPRKRPRMGFLTPTSVRRELPDHILILSERHLRRKVQEYVRYFNCARPHQGINVQIQIPSGSPPVVILLLSQRRRIPILGVLHHDYQWAA